MTFSSRRNLLDAWKMTFSSRRNLLDAWKITFSSRRNLLDARKITFSSRRNLPDARKMTFSSRRKLLDARKIRNHPKKVCLSNLEENFLEICDWILTTKNYKMTVKNITEDRILKFCNGLNFYLYILFG